MHCMRNMEKREYEFQLETVQRFDVSQKDFSPCSPFTVTQKTGITMIYRP